VSATPEVFPVINADGVTIVTPPGVSYEEALKLARTKSTLLIAQYGSRKAIPPGEYNSQEGIIPLPGDDDISYAELVGRKLKSGGERFVDTLGTALDLGSAGIFRDETTDQDIKTRQLVLEQKAKDRAKTEPPSVQFMDILDENNRQDIREELNYDSLSEKDKEKYRKLFPNLNLDAKEQGVTDMVIRWAAGGLAESLPFMAAPLAGGVLGAEKVPPQISKIPLVGKRLAPIAKTAGFVIGSTIAGMPQFFGGNLERQIEEGRLTAEELNKPGAFAAAIGQSASDSLLFALLGRYGGTLQKTTAIEMTKHIVKGGAKSAATEGFTEVVQTALERLQAGLTIDPRDEEALREYINAGTLGITLGGGIGTVTSAVQAATKEEGETPYLTFSDPSDMSGTLSRVRDAQAGNLQEEVEFSLDVPKGPIPFEPLEGTGEPVVDTVVEDEIDASNQLTGLDIRFINEIGESQENSTASLTENDLLRIWNNNAFGIGGTTFEESLNRLDTNNRFEIKKQANGEETFTAIREEDAVSPSSTLTENTIEERVFKSIRNTNLTLDEIVETVENSFTKEEAFTSVTKSFAAIRNAIDQLKQKGRIEDAGPSTNDQGRKAESFRAVKEKETKRKKLVGINSTRVTPADKINIDVETRGNYLFELLPADARVRLAYGSLEQLENAEPNEDGTPNIESRFRPLVDPETGLEVFGDYDVQEFIPPGKTEPDPQLLNNMQIKLDGDETIYKPVWQNVLRIDGNPLRSFADIAMGNKPEMRVSDDLKSGELNLLNAFKGRKIDPNNIPEGSTEAEIREQVEAANFIKFLLNRSTKPFTPRGKLPVDEWEKLLNQTWANRSELREIQSLKTELDRGLKKASRLNQVVNENQKQFKQATMELVERYWSSSKDVVLQDIKDLGHSQEFVDTVVEMRKIVSKNSNKILTLLDKFDPDKKLYSASLRQAIQDRVGSYMTQAYGMYTDPQWKAPNRFGGSVEEKILHANAVTWLASRLIQQQQLLPGESADTKAEVLLNRLYNKESSAVAFGEIMSEPLAEIAPTDLTGARVDTPQGILKPKSVVPKPLKAVMGEITDPGTRMVLTAVKQSEFINGLTVLDDLFNMANEPDNRWVSRVPEGRFNTLITGSELNPFSGYYTTKSIAQGLNDALGSGLVGNAFSVGNPGMDFTFDIYKGAILIPQTWTRGGKILYSPFTQTRNLVSGAGFVTVNGHFPLNNFKPALDAAASYLRGLTPKEAQRMVRLGVMNTSPLIGDLARTYELAGKMDNVSGVIETIQKQEKRSLSKPFKGWLGDKVRKTYQFGDDFWKVVMYLGELDKNKIAFQMPSEVDPKSPEFKEMELEYGGNYLAALLDSKSPEFSEMVEENIKIIEQLMERGDRRPLQLNSATPEARLNEAREELAAYRTRQNVPNYDFIGDFAEVIRFSPFGDFIAFPTEQIRTSANTVTSGINEIKIGRALQKQGGRKKAMGTAIARRGWARVMSFMMYNMTVGVGAKSLALSLKGLKWGSYAALAMFAPDWGEDRNEILISVDSRTGDITTADTSGTDAYDVITEPLRAMIRGVTSEDTAWEKTTGAVTGFAEGVMNFFKQYISPSIYAKGMTAAISGRNERGQPIRNPNQALSTKIGDTLLFLYNELQPGAFVDTKRAFGASGKGTEKLDRFNREQDISNVAKKGFGSAVRERNLPTDWASFQLSSFLNEARKAESIYKKEQYTGGRETLTVADIIEAYKEANDLYLKLVLYERKRINAAGDLSIPPEVMFGGIPDDRFKEISKRDKANLQLNDASNRDGSYNDVTFTAIDPKDFYSQTKEKVIEALAKKGIKDERLEAMEFPGDALYQLQESYEGIVLEGYRTPAVQSDVMENALKYFEIGD